jgi:hypothetical protein
VLVAPIRLSVIEDAASTEAIETMVPFGNDGVVDISGSVESFFQAQWDRCDQQN